MLGGSNTAVLRKLAQSREQWQSPMTMQYYLGKWARSSGLTCVLTTQYIFSFGYRGCNWANSTGQWQRSFGLCCGYNSENDIENPILNDLICKVKAITHAMPVSPSTLKIVLQNYNPL